MLDLGDVVFCADFFLLLFQIAWLFFGNPLLYLS